MEQNRMDAQSTNSYVSRMREKYAGSEKIDDISLAKIVREKHFPDYDENEFLAHIGLQENKEPALNIAKNPQEQVKKEQNPLMQRLRQKYNAYEDADDYALAKLAKAKHQPDMDDKEYYTLLGLEKEFETQRANLKQATLESIKESGMGERWDEIKEYIPDFTANLNPIARVASLFVDEKTPPKSTPTENFMLGATKNAASYAASLGKAFGSKEWQDKGNRVKLFADERLKENDGEIAGFVGEMVGDPINLAPAGIVTQGTRLARVAKSMAGGAAVGGASMAAKNYGDDSMTKDEKNLEIGISAGFVSALNGIIAGVTKGRVSNAIKDVPDLEAMQKNPEAFGVTPQEAEQVTAGAQEYLNKTKPPKASDELGLTQEPKELDQIDNGFQALADEIIPNKDDAPLPRGISDEFSPSKEDMPIQQAMSDEMAPKPELTKEQQLLNAEAEAKNNLRIAEFRKSINKPIEAGIFETQAQKNLEEAQRLRDEIAQEESAQAIAQAEKLLQHPRVDELLNMRENVSAADATYSQKLVSPRYMKHDNMGNGYETEITPATYEKNYNNDFMLTKQDVKNIRANKIDQQLASKLEADLTTLDNHPEWSKQVEPTDFSKYQEPKHKQETPNMSQADLDEANSLFANRHQSLAGGFAGGADSEINQRDYNDDGVHDFKDTLIGAGLGVAGIHGAKKLAPNAFKQEASKGAVDAGMFVGAKGNEKGSFSDVATKKTMREIDDSQINYKPIPKQNVEFDGREFEQNYANLGEIINHPELFKKYPELKDMQVSISSDFGRGGSYAPATNSIQLNKGNTRLRTNEQIVKRQEAIRTLTENPIDDEYSRLIEEIQKSNMPEAHYEKTMELLDNTPTQKRIDAIGEQILEIKNNISKDGSVHLTDDGKSTLLHEVQHSIQEKENWARGGSPEEYKQEQLMHKAINGEIDKIDDALGYNKWFEDNIDTIAKELKGKPYDQDRARKIFAETLTQSTREKYLSKLAEARQIQSENKKMLGLKDGEYPDPQDSYKRLWGEQQARATQARAGMTPEQRQGEDWTQTLAKTEGEYKEPIITYGDGTAMMSPVKIGDNSTSTIDDVKETLAKHRGEYEQIEYSRENWDKVFPNNRVATPFGEIKLGEKQFEKLDPSIPDPKDPTKIKQDRRHHISYIEQTLKNPAFAVKKENGDKLLFFKEIDKDGKQKQYSSIIIDKDGMHIKVSSHPMNYKQIKGEINKNDVVYIAPEDATSKTTNPRSSSEIVDNDIVPQTKEEWTKNITEWHKESHPLTKNEDGSPKVFYHGTMTDFSEFKDTGIKANGSRNGDGFYFTADARKANSYAKKGKDANVMPVYLNAKNIYRGIDQLTPEQRDIYLKTEKPTNEILQDLGFDARAIDDKEVVVFYPTQIKSINNRGTFDKNNPNILMANGTNSLGGAMGGGLVGGMEDTDGNYIPDSWNWKNAAIGAAVGAGVGRLAKAGGVGAFGGKAFESTYKKFKAGKLPNATTLPDETITQLSQRKLQDKFNRVKQLIKVKADFDKIDDAMNPYQAEELMHGRVEDKIRELETKTVTPILEKISKAKLTIDQVDEYLWARHAPERNAKMLENHGKENGSGMSDAEAYAIINKHKNNEAMQEIANDVYTMNRDRLKYIHSEGLESEEFIMMLDANYDNYVPLRREFAEKESFFKTGKGFDIRGKETMRAVGSDRKVESPLMHSILAYEETIVRAEKNQVGKAFLEFTKEFPDESLYTISDVKHIPQYDQNGAVVGVSPNYKADDNVLHVKVLEEVDKIGEDGKAVVGADGEKVKEFKPRVKEITIHDPALATAFKNLNSQQMNSLLQASQKAVRFLAGLSTSYNPEFVLTNFTRDIQSAMINMPDGMKANRATILKDVMPAMKGIYSSVRDGNKNEWSSLYEEMRKEGGTTGWHDLHGVLDMKKSTQAVIDKYEGKVAPLQAFKEVLNYVDDVNSAVENAGRLVAYKMAKESGMTNKKAASIAKNLTVNFNRKGELGATMNALYMFYNASIQGSARMIEQLAKSKTSQALVATIAGIGIGLDNFNRSQNAEAYELVPDYIKDTNYVFMNKDGTYETLKLPYGYNVFKATGDLASKIYHGEMELSKAPSRLLSMTVNAFSPIGVDSESLTHTLSPTLAKPFVEIEQNRNFFGGSIAPEENPYEPARPDSQNYFKSVNPFAKSLAQGMNELTGGTMYESGFIDISPESIEHVVGFATGGLGQLIIRTGTVADQALDKDKKVDMNKVPFLRGMYGVPREKAETNIIYKMYKDSGAQRFSDTERKRFLKWTDAALDKKDINKDQAKKLKKQFVENQRRMDFAKKYNLQAKEQYQNSEALQDAGIDAGLTKSQRKELLKVDK